MSDIYLGNTEIEKAYIGDTLIYEKGGGDSGGGDSGGGSSNDYEFLSFTVHSYASGTSTFTAPLMDKNLVIRVNNTSSSMKSYKIQNSSTSKSFQRTIAASATHWIVCPKDSSTVYVSTGTTSTIG